MWGALFWGGALLSPATGVCLNSVHPDLRSFSSALSMFAYNVLGYAAAPFSCGIIAQHWGLKWGFRVTLLTRCADEVPLARISSKSKLLLSTHSFCVR